MHNRLNGLQNRMWYQHAPLHTGRNVAEWLINNFSERWTERLGSVHWPARSPDLNLLDFHLWNHLKQLVYVEQINIIDQLEDRILNLVRNIQNTKFCRSLQFICFALPGMYQWHFWTSTVVFNVVIIFDDIYYLF